MLLEEPEEANAEGLKLTLENSILKLGLNIERKNREAYFFLLYINKSGNTKNKKKKKKKKRKKSDFLSFNILLPFQPRTLKNSYLDVLNLEHFQD